MNIIFDGMTENEIKSIPQYKKRYKKGEIILSSGTKTDCLGIVVSGSVAIVNDDLWGNRSVLNHLGKGQVFAETYAYLNEPLLVSVQANEDTEILFVQIKNASEKLVRNLLNISNKKSLALSMRMFHTAHKTVRSRVLAYLDTVSTQKSSKEFDIQFNRQQLADYLSVDRSALSNELSKMQSEGLISFRKNHFKIL